MQCEGLPLNDLEIDIRLQLLELGKRKEALSCQCEMRSEGLCANMKPSPFLHFMKVILSPTGKVMLNMGLRKEAEYLGLLSICGVVSWHIHDAFFWDLSKTPRLCPTLVDDASQRHVALCKNLESGIVLGYWSLL
ncbi:hypothetical protein GOP47_0006075 [Adiantum capillus-veneris]|uniref:Uncharacterized protein n=1 Tax=Adiantum capillus-veneris TaxID=13818 RepID=A0A9D4V288_ADICA|nr:hypothetical protein GOP47_0006075 [Adiantum capillus-veneris]